jgi:polyhydroxyalkanoate depolymerase
MPESFMSLFPHVVNSLEAIKIPVRSGMAVAEAQINFADSSFSLIRHQQRGLIEITRRFSALFPWMPMQRAERLVTLHCALYNSLLEMIQHQAVDTLDRFRRERAGELEFLNLFTRHEPRQDWTVAYDPSRVLLDLPGLRVIDISAETAHQIENFTVVFAPRAGHHSNIAERVALFLRDQGLSRMAIVEQKCAEEIPLLVNGKRHYEDFPGQVDQYRLVLEHLAGLTGRPPHLVAICQPGPLLMCTLILYPHLAKTFGSAGSPMHTEAERGFLTDFARAAGPAYIDMLLFLFGRRISEDRPGAGRLCYDGRLQVLGFYLMGYDQHLQNLKRLFDDLRSGRQGAAEKQKAFYQWYNTVHHFPAGFIRDTFKQIFIGNALVRGSLRVGNRQISLDDYPGSVPVWALGGTRDNIAPPLQATGHMDLIRAVPPHRKLSLLCDGGHMGLFRSRRILQQYYSKIAAFMLAHSDRI